MIDLTGEQRDGQVALRHRVAAVRLRRDVVRARGADVVSFLQGQLSQDLMGLDPGKPSYALVLEPGGKVDAWVRVWSTGPEEVLMDLDPGAGQGLLERLNRFRLRVAVDLELLDWEMVAVRGPDTPEPARLVGLAELLAPVDWAGVPGVDLLGPTVLPVDGVPDAPAEALEVLRIEAGHPAMGGELGPALEPRVIPAEAGQWLIDASVSFTKGCYTGQELVARVDSRGSNTPRKLRGIVLADDLVPPAGTDVVVDGAVRGTLSSVGRSVELGRGVALAYLHRSVEPGASADLSWLGEHGEEVTCAAEIRELPLVSG